MLDKPLDSVNAEGSFPHGLAGSQLQHQTIGDGSFRSGLKPWQKVRPSIEILCNNQASYAFLSKDSLMTVYVFSFLNDMTVYVFGYLNDAKIEQVHALFFYSWPTLQLMRMHFRICSLILWRSLVTTLLFPANY